MRVTRIRTYPLTRADRHLQRTSHGSFGTISILVVVVETDAGISGVARGPGALLAQGLCRIGERAAGAEGDRPEPRRLPTAFWAEIHRSLSGRSGGVLIAIDPPPSTPHSGDISGQGHGQPVLRLLGGMGREQSTRLRSSIPWERRCRRQELGRALPRLGLFGDEGQDRRPGRGLDREGEAGARGGRPRHPALGRQQLDLRRRRGAHRRQGAGRSRLCLVRGADRARGHRGLSLAPRPAALEARRRRERYTAARRAPLWPRAHPG